jgi:hypothetical protein
MAKTSLRVSKWLGTTPAIAVCSACHREFKVPLDKLKRVTDARGFLKLQFAEHSCQDHLSPDEKTPSGSKS